jgi:hypothetical protein
MSRGKKSARGQIARRNPGFWLVLKQFATMLFNLGNAKRLMSPEIDSKESGIDSKESGIDSFSQSSLAVSIHRLAESIPYN